MGGRQPGHRGSELDSASLRIAGDLRRLKQPVSWAITGVAVAVTIDRRGQDGTTRGVCRTPSGQATTRIFPTEGLLRSVADVKSPDLERGAFSDEGPWVMPEQAMVWQRRGIGELRIRTAALVPELAGCVGDAFLRSGGRSYGWWLGGALLGWRFIDRRHPETARAGLSRRLRVALPNSDRPTSSSARSSRREKGIFPAELVGEFRMCRDQVPAETFDSVRSVVRVELGQSARGGLRRVRPLTLAAASIAQVHRAQLITGEEVVVKVQRPTVRAQVRRRPPGHGVDLAPFLVGRIPVAALANPPAFVELFAETIVEELDFRLEAENMLDVARGACADSASGGGVPRPHPELVTRAGARDGAPRRLRVRRRRRDEGRRSIDTTAVIRVGMRGFLEGCMVYGVFHGDLHGGNLLVQRDGRVALLDFGITGRLDEKRRLAFLRCGHRRHDERPQRPARRVDRPWRVARGHRHRQP